MKWLWALLFLLVLSSVGVAQTAFTDNFDQHALDPRWTVDTGNCPTQPNSTCTFQTSNVDLSGGNLRLQLTQTAGGTAVSTGAEVRSVGLYGYGTYTIKWRAASTATNVAAGGISVSGCDSSPFLFVNNSQTEIDMPEIECNKPTIAEWTTWNTLSSKQATSTTFVGWDTAVHETKMIWQPGQVQFYIDGTLVSTHTQNIPTAPAFFMFSIFGTNSSTFGGVATTGNRYMYVTQASFTPAAPAGVNQYYVSPTGNDSNSGTQSSPWLTIAHASSALALGTSGTIVHVAAGTYNGDIITAHAGTASQRITFISDTLYGAHIVGNGGNLIVWKSTGDYQTISQFDITGTATDYEGIAFFSSHGRALHNKVHDLPGTACPANGGEGIGDAGGGSFSFSDNQAIGNLVYNIGPSGCNVIHGIYWSNPGDVTEANVVGTVSGQCITSYHAATSLVISNNTVFNCGHHGILLGNNASTLSSTTVENNIVASIASGIGIDCFSGLGSNIRVANNIVYNSSGIGGAQIGNCTVSGTITSNPNFVNYQISPTVGDYHLQAGSPAIGAGSSTCASGGITPCTPSTDFDGNSFVTQDIGAYAFNGTPPGPIQPTTVTITWVATVTPSPTYSLYRSTVSGGPYTVLQTNLGCCTVNDLTADPAYMLTGQYCYVMTATSGGVESIKSNESCVGATSQPPIPPVVPPVLNPNPTISCYGVPMSLGGMARRERKPRLILASFQNNPINITSSGVLTWLAADFAISYNVKRSTVPGGPYTLIGTGLLQPGCIDNRVAPKTTYYWVVSAVNSIGESPDSAEVSVFIP